MSTALGHPHLNLPHLHVHSPHVDWREVERPILFALATGVVLLTLAIAALAAREVASALPQAAPALQSALDRVDLTRHYRHQDRTVDYQSMYGRSAEAPSVEHMYARPRPLRY
jgi:hypothetical protein